MFWWVVVDARDSMNCDDYKGNLGENLAVDVVWCEPLSRQIPVNNEKYREFLARNGIAGVARRVFTRIVEI